MIPYVYTFDIINEVKLKEMGINMYMTLYRCIRDKFKYQYQIANIGYQNSRYSDSRELFPGIMRSGGIDIKDDATSDIIEMLICCN